MKILIDIPKEFIDEYNNDKFKISLERLKIGARLLAGRNEIKIADMLIEAFQNAKENEDAPTVQSEYKKGKWIDEHCSECGQYVYHGDVRNYCPNCGADMMRRNTRTIEEAIK